MNDIKALNREQKAQLLMALLRDPEVCLVVFDPHHGRNSLDGVVPETLCMNGSAIQIEVEYYEDE